MGNGSSHHRKHRQKSHDQSHAEAEITPILQGHPLVPTDEAVWIDSKSTFLSLCHELTDNGIFSFDTEFIGEDSYYAKTCLVQIATTKKVALIDPFVIKDLTPLYELIANPTITKVLHSGSQDLEPVARLLGKPPAAIFDTQLACGLIGYPWPISLTRMIEAILNHDVGGHFTFSQWDARPLSRRQCVYAADDVRYLLAIHDCLTNQLEELGRTTWGEEEFSTLTTMQAYQFDLAHSVRKICKSKNPKRKELQRMQALVSIREEIAKNRNLPTRLIIPKDCIVALSRKPVETTDQLASLRGFPRNIASQHGKVILDAMNNAESLEPISIRKPQAIEREVQTQQELEGVWSLFGAWCIGNRFSPKLVTNRITFTDWYLALRDGTQANDSPLSNGWRSKAVFEFVHMIEGTSAITFNLDGRLHAKKDSP